jgi:RNA polymerase sigma factor (sigma-70 family)
MEGTENGGRACRGRTIMASERGGVVLRQIGHLFGLGTASGLTEWQLVHRYARLGDEAAFAALVARHGPMVLGVCRRLLSDPSDVEDAFQATFLVLIRKARALGPNDPVGHWLYGVARRVALRARSDSTRRRSRERPIATVVASHASTEDDVSLGDLRQVIDHELGRLPASYRTAVVLCYLQGMTHEDAAQLLGWPLGTVKGRLARARDLLRARLTRRGLATTLSSGALAGWLSRDATAGVPEHWSETVVKLAVQITAGRATAGLVSVSAAALAEGVLWAMTIHQLKAAALALGVLACVAVGAGAFARQSKDGGDTPKAKTAALEAASDNSTASKTKAVDLFKAKPDPEPVDDSARRIAKQGFDMALENFQAGTVDADKVHTWSNRIYELDVENAEKPRQIEALASHRQRMEQLESVAKSHLGQNERSNLELLNARYFRHEAERMTSLVEKAGTVRPVPPPAGPQPLAFNDSGTAIEGDARQLKANVRLTTNPAAAPAAVAASEEPGQDARSQAIRKKLDAAITMSFAEETALQDVIKWIKGNTESQDFPTGIPIYVDPIGLQEAEKTLTSVITLDLEGVPLRRTLHLLLRQLTLCYWIQDGMIVISSESSEGGGQLPPPIHEPSPRMRMEDKLERGELTVEERKAFIEMLKDESQIEKIKAEIVKYRNPPKQGGKVGGGFQ